MALQSMIDKLIAAKTAYSDQLKELGPDLANQVAAYLAECMPPGHYIKWKQGTPSFNDGEPCRFRVREPYLFTCGESGRQSDNEDDELELGYAIDRYGTEDKEESYEAIDYSKPLEKGPYGHVTKYGTVTKTYVSQGFPIIEGYTKEQLVELDRRFHNIPADMIMKAFGDGAAVRVFADGTFDCDDWYDG